MFENYLAKKKDFEAIEEGLSFVWRKELDFIFKKRSLIEKAVVVSYDCKFIYLWSRFPLRDIEKINCSLEDYQAYRIPHTVPLRDGDQRGWCAGLMWEVTKLLPRSIRESPKISGGLLTPFLEIQKTTDRPLNPYTTYESYLATIIHEFGHIYYDQYPKKKGNKELGYLGAALKLYQGREVDLEQLNVEPYFLPYASEIFATCTEYTAASLFWPTYKANFDKYYTSHLSPLTTLAKGPTLEESAHNFAAVIGQILLAKHPKTWPQKVLSLRHL